MLARDSGSRGFSVATALEIGVDESIFIDYLVNELWAAYFLYLHGKENEVELVITDEQPWIPKTLNELCNAFRFGLYGKFAGLLVHAKNKARFRRAVIIKVRWSGGCGIRSRG